VWHLLEEHLELVLANAQHIRNVPGRKTDVNDAAWIADLLAHGLIRSSFVPPAPIQELRDLTRTRKQLVREISQHTLRIQKTLEDANLKLGSVLSNVLGSSGRAILSALIGGETDPQRLADLAQGAQSAVAGAGPAAASPARHRHYFRREALYHLVWTAPVAEVAERLGVSDVALAKLCRRAAIPTPGRVTGSEPRPVNRSIPLLWGWRRKDSLSC
jgi:hypothetical protein